MLITFSYRVLFIAGFNLGNKEEITKSAEWNSGSSLFYRETTKNVRHREGGTNSNHEHVEFLSKVRLLP